MVVTRDAADHCAPAGEGRRVGASRQTSSETHHCGPTSKSASAERAKCSLQSQAREHAGQGRKSCGLCGQSRARPGGPCSHTIGVHLVGLYSNMFTNAETRPQDPTCYAQRAAWQS